MTENVQPVMSATSQPAQVAGGSPGKAEFLALLAAQLRYQSPLEPMSERDMVAQLAQFSVLEELGRIRAGQEGGIRDLETRLVTMAAVNLLGKEVSALIETDDEPLMVTGIVTATRWDSADGAELRVDGRWIPWHLLTGARLAGGEDDD